MVYQVNFSIEVCAKMWIEYELKPTVRLKKIWYGIYVLVILKLNSIIMSKKLTATTSVIINASKSKVWDALTNPAAIKAYLFGTDVHTDWKKGSPITYTGVWEGKAYEDKGVIVDIKPGEYYHSTYYSPLSGKEDSEENYANVIWAVKEDGSNTIASVSQDNIETEEGIEKAKQNWDYVLKGMKEYITLNP